MSVVVVHKSCFLKKRQFTTMSTTTAGFESKRGTPKFNVHWMKLLGYLRSSTTIWLSQSASALKGKGSPYKTTECRFPELIPVLGSQPAGAVSHKPGGRLSLFSARPAVTIATLKRAATNIAAWWTEARWVWTVCLRLLLDSVTTAIWTRALLRLSPAR